VLLILVHLKQRCTYNRSLFLLIPVHNSVDVGAVAAIEADRHFNEEEA
jgi:hypothetical protein